MHHKTNEELSVLIEKATAGDKGSLETISPTQLDFTTAVPMETIIEVKEAMEDIDDLSQVFAFCKTYRSPEGLKEFIQKFLDGASYSVVANA